MSNSHKPKLENSADCLRHLQSAMVCLDRIFLDSAPDHAGRIGLATAHLQLVIDILTDAEPLKP